jgi:hypothetical protein
MRAVHWNAVQFFLSRAGSILVSLPAASFPRLSTSLVDVAERFVSNAGFVSRYAKWSAVPLTIQIATTAVRIFQTWWRFHAVSTLSKVSRRDALSRTRPSSLKAKPLRRSHNSCHFPCSRLSRLGRAVIVSRRKVRLQAHSFATLILRQVPRSLHAITTGKEARPIAHGTPLVRQSETTTAPALAEAQSELPSAATATYCLPFPKKIQAIASLVNACPSHLSS